MGCTTRNFKPALAAPLMSCNRQPGLPVATVVAPVDLMWLIFRSSS